MRWNQHKVTYDRQYCQEFTSLYIWFPLYSIIFSFFVTHVHIFVFYPIRIQPASSDVLHSASCTSAAILQPSTTELQPSTTELQPSTAEL